MTTYLKMLPLAVWCNDTMWWRVDDLWWSSRPTWSFPCLSCSWPSCLLYRTPSFSFLYHVILLSFLLWILTLCLDLLLLSFLSVRASWLWVHWARSLLAFSFSLHHPILEMRIRTIACSSSINLDFCWFLVDELGFIRDANSSSSLIVFVF